MEWSGPRPGPTRSAACFLERRVRVDRVAAAGMYLEVEMGRPAPGVAGVAHVADDVTGLDPPGAPEGVEMGADVGDAVVSVEEELQPTHGAGDELDLPGDRGVDLGAAGSEDVDPLMPAAVWLAHAPVVDVGATFHGAHPRCTRDREHLAHPDQVGVLQAVRLGDGGGGRPVLAGDSVERFPGCHGVAGRARPAA